MEWFVRAFLKASVAWLAIGVTIGIAMAAHPVWTVYLPAHLHVMLFGFVGMMIFGVAYHVIPRFAGYPLHNKRAAGVHWWLANGGLTLMVCGFVMRVVRPDTGTIVLSAGGALSALGAYIFAYLMWRTVGGSEALREVKRVKHEKATSRRIALPIA
ncbi:MAG: hypothetical protein V4550_14555 [Gemmatimonadota bacterium]